MTRTEFIVKIMNTECEACPICFYCRSLKSLSCTQTSRTFFNKYHNGGKIEWQSILDLNSKKRLITRRP